MVVRKICFPYIGDTVGGSHIASLPLLKKLDQRKFKTIVVVHQTGPLTAYFDAQGVDYTVLGSASFLNGGIGLSGYCAAFGRAIPAITWYLHRHGVDIVHGNDLRTNHTWSVAARLSSTAMVWHQRTKFAPSRLTNLTIHLAHRIICNSEFCRSSLPMHHGNRAEVMTDPFDVELSPPSRNSARRRILDIANWPEFSRIVGFCGTLSRQKRPDVFIDAAAQVVAKFGTSARFAILGNDRDGFAAELERKAARLGIGNQIKFLGFRTPAMDWIAGFDVFAAPQFDDAFGRALLEAMHAGTPVVASKSGGHLDIIEDGVTGMLTTRDDASDMAKAIMKILDQAEFRRSLVLEATASVRKNYAEQPHLDACERIFESLCPTPLMAIA